jgi:transcriptional regulator with XRE-family HTH domain
MVLRAQYADDSLVAKVGARIRKLRTEQGASLREFGKRAGVHPFHVMAVELGQLAANTKTLRRIADALGVTPVDLLNVEPDDDAGAILEHLRLHPGSVRAVMLRVASAPTCGGCGFAGSCRCAPALPS